MLEGSNPRRVRLEARLVSRHGRDGFTLLEIIVVVVILAIAAVMVVPMMSSGAATKVLAAAQRVAADLDYAKSMAITHGCVYRVAFISTKQYQLEDQNGAVVAHPVNAGTHYVVDLAGGAMDGVEITSTSFDGTHEVRFDSLGSPYNGSGNHLTSGVITLHGGDCQQTIRVKPMTGVITIGD